MLFTSFSTQAQADLTQEVITKGILLISQAEPQKSLPVRFASPSSWVCLPEKAVSNLHFVPPRLGPSHPDKRTEWQADRQTAGVLLKHARSTLLPAPIPRTPRHHHLLEPGGPRARARVPRGILLTVVRATCNRISPRTLFSLCWLSRSIVMRWACF